VYLATYTVGQFNLSFAAFSPTELRLLLIAGNLALFGKPWVQLGGHQLLLFDVGGVIGIAGLSFAFLWSLHRTVSSVLTVCLTKRGNPTPYSGPFNLSSFLSSSNFSSEDTCQRSLSDRRAALTRVWFGDPSRTLADEYGR